jgi:hypothetical protein
MFRLVHFPRQARLQKTPDLPITWPKGFDPLFHARNSEGYPCSVWDPAAVRFCAVGALWRAASELTDDLDVFSLVEMTALQVVASAGRADALQT